MEIRHIPGKKNPADGLSRRHWRQDDRINQTAKQEESRLFKVLRLGDNPSDQDIQAALDRLFVEKQDNTPAHLNTVQITGSDSVSSAQSREPDYAQCMVTRTSLQIDDSLRDEIQKKLEDESPYREILSEIDNAPLSCREVQRGVEKFRLRGNSLVIHRPDFHEDDPYWKLVIPDNKDIKHKLFREFHDLPSTGHPGFNRTLQLVRRHLYWRGMTHDVRDYVLSCPVCQLEKGETQLPRGELRPLKVPEERWQEVSIDFITKLPTTKKGNDSVLVAVDRATKYVHIVPCQESISARHTALLYWRNVARYHGIPRTIFSDRDVRFTSQFWKSLWKFFGTGLHFSTSFHPQTQGQVERVNAMFEQILRCTVHELGEPRNWDDMVPHIEFCINTQPNRSTGYSAFYLLYGHHPLTPIELIKESDKNSVEMVDRFAHRLRKLYQKAKENVHRANEAYKQHFDKRRRPASFTVGQMVLLSTKHLRMKGTPSKLQRRFVGPFAVEERWANKPIA